MGILITGAAGLIGSTLVKKLENQGHEVISCDIRFRNNPLSFFSEDIVPLLALTITHKYINSKKADILLIQLSIINGSMV